jgi:4-diphosphocytidyl-2C-methyl-D-erythritol kinase
MVKLFHSGKRFTWIIVTGSGASSFGLTIQFSNVMDMAAELQSHFADTMCNTAMNIWIL